MKLGELIEKLQDQYGTRGDIPVFFVINDETELGLAVDLDFSDYGEGLVVEIVAADYESLE